MNPSAVQTKLSPKLGAVIVEAVKDPKTGPDVFAILAKLAAGEGAESTARALNDRAAAARRRNGVSAEHVGLDATAEPSTASSKELSLADLQSLSDVLAAGRAPDAEEKGRVGIYAISVPRLADLDVVTRPRKVGKIWQAEWPGVSREQFLADQDLQREVLFRSLRNYAQDVDDRYRAAVGKKLGGTVVTLSGLLAVAHVAGLRGLETWLRDPSVRVKFGGTTKLFAAANGIF